MATELWRKNNQDKMREYRRRYYHRNKESQKIKIISRKKSITEWAKNLKSKLKCEICGFNHPAALDFHHNNPKEKDMEISMAMRNGWSKKRILSEIEKCKILCANCHRVFHNTINYPVIPLGS